MINVIFPIKSAGGVVGSGIFLCFFLALILKSVRKVEVYIWQEKRKKFKDSTKE